MAGASLFGTSPRMAASNNAAFGCESCCFCQLARALSPVRQPRATGPICRLEFLNAACGQSSAARAASISASPSGAPERQMCLVWTVIQNQSPFCSNQAWPAIGLGGGDGRAYRNHIMPVTGQNLPSVGFKTSCNIQTRSNRCGHQLRCRCRRTTQSGATTSCVQPLMPLHG